MKASDGHRSDLVASGFGSFGKLSACLFSESTIEDKVYEEAGNGNGHKDHRCIIVTVASTVIDRLYLRIVQPEIVFKS